MTTLVIPIHTSDRMSFKACRRRWDILSDLRQGMKPIETPQPLSFGSAAHKGFEIFNDPLTWELTKSPGSRVVIVESAISAARNEIVEMKRRYLRLTNLECLEEEQEEQYQKDLELIDGMLRHYFEYCRMHNFERYTPLHVELSFEVLIFSGPEVAKLLPKLWRYALENGYDDLEIVYRGRIDMLAIDDWGEYWIWDWKTAGRIRDTMGFLELDEQLGSYNWALEHVLGIKIAGNIYAEIWKDYPKPLKENANVRLGRRFSVNQQQGTSYDIAKAQLEAEGESLELYADYLHFLQSDGIEYVRRTPIYRNAHELADLGTRIRMETLDMLDDPRIYPSPRQFGCDNCPARAVCIGMNDGSDVSWILKEYFTKELRTNV